MLSTADKPIVFRVGADPDPLNGIGFQKPQCPVMAAYPSCDQILAVTEPAIPNRRMSRIGPP